MSTKTTTPPLAPRRNQRAANALTPVQTEALALFDLGFNIGPLAPLSDTPFAPQALVQARLAREALTDLFGQRAGIYVVPGKFSLNLAILACTTDEALRFHEAQFTRRNLSPWIVASTRGGYIWWLSKEGELANIAPVHMIGQQSRLLGNHSHAPCPPSLGLGGTSYRWRSRVGALPPVLAMRELDWLPLKLSVRPKPASMALPALDAADLLWERARMWAEQYPWPALPPPTEDGHGCTAQTARAIFIACCQLAQNAQSEEFRASVRTLAELANLSKNTAHQALVCLTHARYLTEKSTGRFAFGAQVMHDWDSDSAPPRSGVPIAHTAPAPDAPLDVFRRAHGINGQGGLGKTAERAWRTLLDGPLGTRALVKRVGCTQPSISRVLARLAEWGLVECLDPEERVPNPPRGGRRWVALPVDEHYLTSIAEQLGTHGMAAERRARHNHTKTQRATDAVRQAREAWEQARTAPPRKAPNRRYSIIPLTDEEDA